MICLSERVYTLKISMNSASTIAVWTLLDKLLRNDTTLCYRRMTWKGKLRSENTRCNAAKSSETRSTHVRRSQACEVTAIRAWRKITCIYHLAVEVAIPFKTLPLCVTIIYCVFLSNMFHKHAAEM